MQQADLIVRYPIRLSDISPEEFRRLERPDEPFLSYAFLSALEHSACICDATGWQPHHFAIVNASGRLIAFAPVYIKKHSYGEYVFDWSWADAYQRHGLDYYPKLVSSVPFTPSTSRRLLVDGQAPDAARCAQLFCKALRDDCAGLESQSGAKYSSAHILFPDEGLSTLTGTHWLKRHGVQYHWFNRAYTSFDSFLDALNSSKRKNIRKERKRLNEAGIQSYWKPASALSEREYRAFLACYNHTYNRRGQMAYLNEAFFKQLFRDMSEQCLLLFAIDSAEDIVASALFVKGADTLYGRYWGALKDIPLLHFELCYYAGIEYCIANNLQRFDAGAQGEHKLLRGFEPVSTCSYHYITHSDFKGAIDAFLTEESEHIEQYKEDAMRWLPYKSG